MSEWQQGITPIEIQCGREGLWGIRNKNMVPIGSALILRNATLEDHTWRTGGGATVLGVAITATPTILAGVDWWPTATAQRNVVATSNGKIYKDDGTGNAWAQLATGLTTGGNPFFTKGGSESAGRARKLFYCDGLNVVQVLAADGAATANITLPPADWAAANQPSWMVNHQGAVWGGGNANDRHRLYKSGIADHENFTGAPYSYSLFPGEDDGTTAAISYKGGLLVWKFPTGVYFVDTSSAATADWSGKRIGNPGAAGPACVALVETDVIWVSPDGGWHRISATNATGSVRAEDLSYTKLGSYQLENYNLARLGYAHLVYYSQKLEVMLGLAQAGQTSKTRRLHMDLQAQQEQGPRWLTWDRDTNESLWIRRNSLGVLSPMMGDNAGLVWQLDQSTRSKSGMGYTFEAFLSDTDFGTLVQGWAGRPKNLHYLQLEYDPRTTGNVTVEVWLDGRARQSVSFLLTSSGGTVLPFTLPAVFGSQTIQASRIRPLAGSGTRIALRVISTSNNADVSISKMILGLSLGG